MEWSAAPSPDTTALTALQAAVPPAPAAVPTPLALPAAFARVPGPRPARGPRFPLAAIRALTACAHDPVVALAQEGIRSTAEKTEAGLPVAPALSARAAWRGRGVAGAARCCQRHLLGRVLDADGDYLVLVREPPPPPYHDIALRVGPPADLPAPPPPPARREAVTPGKGHGPTRGRRHLVASTDPNGSCAWPGRAPACRPERAWCADGARRRQGSHGLTRLPPAVADAARLLARKRGPGGVANGPPRVQDGTRGADASPIRPGAGPRVLAVLRDTARGVLRAAGRRAIAARPRHDAQFPAQAVARRAPPPRQYA